eukprot:351737-Chlamydomonas_euryale.AAC.5
MGAAAARGGAQGGKLDRQSSSTQSSSGVCPRQPRADQGCDSFPRSLSPPSLPPSTPRVTSTHPHKHPPHPGPPRDRGGVLSPRSPQSFSYTSLEYTLPKLPPAPPPPPAPPAPRTSHSCSCSTVEPLKRAMVGTRDLASAGDGWPPGWRGPERMHMHMHVRWPLWAQVASRATAGRPGGMGMSTCTCACISCGRVLAAAYGGGANTAATVVAGGVVAPQTTAQPCAMRPCAHAAIRPCVHAAMHAAMRSRGNAAMRPCGNANRHAMLAGCHLRVDACWAACSARVHMRGEGAGHSSHRDGLAQQWRRVFAAVETGVCGPSLMLPCWLACLTISCWPACPPACLSTMLGGIRSLFGVNI